MLNVCTDNYPLQSEYTQRHDCFLYIQQGWFAFTTLLLVWPVFFFTIVIRVLHVSLCRLRAISYCFLKSVGVTHRARCNLRSGVFFFQITEIKGEGMIASYARCAVRRETRGCQPQKPSWPSRGMCMTPLTLRKTRQYLQSNNGGFVFFFFTP